MKTFLKNGVEKEDRNENEKKEKYQKITFGILMNMKVGLDLDGEMEKMLLIRLKQEELKKMN